MTEPIPPPLAGRRVLVVDDNPDAAETLEMLLRLLGAEVHTAADGRSALEILRRVHPAVVVLDIGLPDVDGYEVARRVREEPGGSDTLLIALTGWGEEEDQRRSREAGIDHHLVKPVDFAALEQLLRAPRQTR